LQDTFDPTFIRLNQVDSIRNPLLGPLAIEDTGKAGIIVREGFNDPDELIDSVTYVKAAEVIRMLRLLLGSHNFKKGKELYFSRYKDSNANTDQFFECFEETSGKRLAQFKDCWLYRIGYPKVSYKTQYDKDSMTYRIRVSQEPPNSTEKPFHLPIELAVIDRSGKAIQGTNTVFEFNSYSAELVFENINPEPAFVSMNRDFSFYGTCERENE
ncbi:MAG: DUF3458 domain-containing protein, partial [Desulfomonilaceae bacterium]